MSSHGSSLWNLLIKYFSRHRFKYMDYNISFYLYCKDFSFVLSNSFYAVFLIYLLNRQIRIRSITTTVTTELIPDTIPAVSAILPMILGIRIDPILAKVKIKLQAIEYLLISLPAKDTVVG